MGKSFGEDESFYVHLYTRSLRPNKNDPIAQDNCLLLYQVYLAHYYFFHLLLSKGS